MKLNFPSCCKQLPSWKQNGYFYLIFLKYYDKMYMYVLHMKYNAKPRFRRGVRDIDRCQYIRRIRLLNQKIQRKMWNNYAMAAILKSVCHFDVLMQPIFCNFTWSQPVKHYKIWWKFAYLINQCRREHTVLENWQPCWKMAAILNLLDW